MLIKRLKSLVLGGILCGIAVVHSFAAEHTVPVVLNVEPMVLDVTVPSSLSISVDGRGVVTTGTNAKVVNNSRGAVVVKNVDVIANNGWGTVAFDTDFSGTRVGSKQFGFKLNDIPTTSEGFVWGQSPIIRGVKDGVSSDLSITYDATFPAQHTAIADLNVANIVFTVDWYE